MNIPFKLGKNFEKIIEPQLKKPEIAIIELIANSWDADANNVCINWPEIDGLKVKKEKFTIIDDGEGMSKNEFIDKWAIIGYDKQNSSKYQREIIGKNGRGRLGLFCFTDKYRVSTSKNGIISSFEVERSNDNFAKINEINPITDPFIKDSQIQNGTYIECPIEKDYINIKTVKQTITLKFGADSNFNVYLNNEKINLFDFKDDTQFESIYFENDNEKEIKIYQIQKNKSTTNLSSYEVVWWVKNRFVEHDTWENLNINLDSTNKKENKNVFIISADFLENDVKSDWTGFRQSEVISDVKQLISQKINQMMSDVITSSIKEKKINVLKSNKNALKTLNPVEKYEVGKYIDEIIEKCDSITNKDLSNVVDVLTKMETSNKKYSFFENIVNISSSQLDKLTEIVEKWSVDDAYIVLNELYARIDLINRLELLIDDPQTKELQQLQPLFKEGLWIFHPKYEGTTRFTSNQTMNKVMVDLLGVKDYNSENAKKRPDFVVLENSTVNAYSSDFYVDDSEVIDGFDEVLIIELKKGGSVIGSTEKFQAFSYAKEIVKKGHAGENTNITGYVLGSRVDSFEHKPLTEDNIKIYAKSYELIIRTAKNRTFNLINKIKNVKGLTDVGDEEIDEVLREDNVQKKL